MYADGDRPGRTPGWMVDRPMGCWLWNPDPRPAERVSWTGDCGADGRAEGHGVREWRSPGAGTSRYAGQMLAGREHGRGAWTGPAGESYVGDYQDGRFHGRGVFTCCGGTRLEGDWVNGQLHGTGRASWASGTAYEGDYREGLFHGLGTLTRADGRRLTGEWRRGQLDGHAAITWPDGSRFEGVFADGLPNGRGTIATRAGDSGSVGSGWRGVSTVRVRRRRLDEERRNASKVF